MNQVYIVLNGKYRTITGGWTDKKRDARPVTEQMAKLILKNLRDNRATTVKA